jgi:LPXTG-motif cell wall-anchored protein
MPSTTAATAPPANAAPATTPTTGTTSGPLVAVGLALLAAGLGLALLSRRRLSTTP